MVDHLLDAGADSQAEDDSGRTPLDIALENHSKRCSMRLLERDENLCQLVKLRVSNNSSDRAALQLPVEEWGVTNG
jgi:ankyrin repeat protein